MRRIIALILSFAFTTGYFSDVFCQNTQNPALREIIDIPTAGTLSKGSFDVGLRMYPQGGVLSNMSVGLMNRLMVSVFYGGENCIGEGEINWNPQIGFEMRVRIIEESLDVNINYPCVFPDSLSSRFQCMHRRPSWPVSIRILIKYLLQRSLQ